MTAMTATTTETATATVAVSKLVTAIKVIAKTLETTSLYDGIFETHALLRVDNGEVHLISTDGFVLQEWRIGEAPVGLKRRYMLDRERIKLLSETLKGRQHRHANIRLGDDATLAGVSLRIEGVHTATFPDTDCVKPTDAPEATFGGKASDFLAAIGPEALSINLSVAPKPKTGKARISLTHYLLVNGVLFCLNEVNHTGTDTAPSIFADKLNKTMIAAKAPKKEAVSVLLRADYVRRFLAVLDTAEVDMDIWGSRRITRFTCQRASLVFYVMPLTQPA